MTSTMIEVDAWADLDGLPGTMDELGDQIDDVVRHARTWVCNPDGFEPSPACLLQPLAEVMHLLDQAFAEAGRRFAEQWEQLRDGVVVASSDLRGTDSVVATSLPEVA